MLINDVNKVKVGNIVFGGKKRFALSKEALNIYSIPSLSQISFIPPATSSINS